MGSRRTPDSPQPSRPALPDAVPRSAKPATQPPAAAVKKSTKPFAAAPPPAGAAAAPTVPAAKPSKRRTSAGKKHATTGAHGATGVSADARRGMIAKAAYLRGESRGFPPGGEAEDWLAAEEEIDALLSGGSGAAQ
jgi:Protein of unknown function (DUF2934)